MAGRRRIQRSVRVTVAAIVLVCAALLVAGSALSRSFPALAGAAVIAVLAGAVAVRVVYSEVLTSRRDSARMAAEQARSLQQATAAAHREQVAFRERMSGRVLERDLTVSQLSTALRAARRAATDAESRADEATGQAHQEAERADVAQRQLARLLDEVFGTALVDEDPEREIALLRSVRRPDPSAGRRAS